MDLENIKRVLFVHIIHNNVEIDLHPSIRGCHSKLTRGKNNDSFGLGIQYIVFGGESSIHGFDPSNWVSGPSHNFFWSTLPISAHKSGAPK